MTLRDTLTMIADFWPPKPEFTTDDIPDSSGKVMIVTGGNAGIGPFMYFRPFCHTEPLLTHLCACRKSDREIPPSAQCQSLYSLSIG